MVPSMLRVRGRGNGRYKECEMVMSLVNSWNQRPGWLEPGEWREVVENECKEADRCRVQNHLGILFGLWWSFKWSSEALSFAFLKIIWRLSWRMGCRGQEWEEGKQLGLFY